MSFKLSQDELDLLSQRTVGHYEKNAPQFWEATRDHDVSQNYEAFLDALPKKTPLKILDFGCGPGRDLRYFKKLGHLPTGIDGSEAFCRMAQAYSHCPVWHQNFLKLQLPAAHFDGIFANASLFHIPSQELPRVLTELSASLVTHGVLFCSNPRGNYEGWNNDRYGTFLELPEYEKLFTATGFSILHHYYRPAGVPREAQAWLAIVAKKDAPTRRLD